MTRPATQTTPVRPKNPSKLRCLHCQYQWLPRIHGRPVKCPDCQCRDWDKKPVSSH